MTRTETDRNGSGEQMPWEELQFSTATDFIDQHPTLSDPVIDGICRRGETVNVIGSTKEGKSWMILGMALSIASGRPWLGNEVTQGKVALIDNELHPGTLSSRIKTVARAMNIPDDVLDDDVFVLALRGNLKGLLELMDPLNTLKGQGVVMVGLDAFYRTIPSGVSENDNAAMAGIYNTIDRWAGMLDAMFVLNHHSTKGDQAGKRVTDVGSGAGSISRAADTHLIIRPHQEQGLAVLDAACRSFPPIDAQSLRFEFPLWSASDEEPELRQTKGRSDASQEKRDAETDQAVLDVITESGDRWVSRSKVRTLAGYGPERVNRSLRRLNDRLEMKQDVNPKNKNETIDYFRRNGCDRRS